MLKKLFLSFVLMSFIQLSFAQSLTEQYAHVRIYANDAQLHKLAEQGVSIDHGTYKKDFFYENDFSLYELEIIKKSGIEYKNLGESRDFYKKLQEKWQYKAPADCNTQSSQELSYAIPENYEFGSMGGYLTYDEMLEQLDKMKELYPHLISAKAPISDFETHEGRPIFFLRISDNPENEENEPKVLYDALHHAREANSMAQMIFYMWYVLENYDKDESIKYLVENTEMYFVPCVNPDGYIYNETTDPNGGGFWRKNRFDNGDGTFGVDLNRNYGFAWGLDNEGSSPNTNSDVYRGTAPFSEAETQAMKWLCENYEFQLAFNYHTYSNLLIYPWGYVASTLTPDAETYVAFGEVMTHENHYTHGTGDQTVGYVTNGDSDDWMYGEQDSKNKIFAFTPEVGSGLDGFWPDQSRIITLNRENMWMNLTLARLVGNFGFLQETDGNTFTETDIFVHYNLKRLGLNGDGAYDVSFSAITDGLTFGETSKSYQLENLLDEVNDSVSLNIDSDLILTDEIKYV